jgi:DNA-nicking Smr family endonuclease
MNKYARMPEKVFDLHGYTTHEAREFLLTLLAEQKYAYVRLITGKGDLRNGPVLRSYVESFLRERGVSVERAKISQGGDGALEVFFG